jgi:hypothetical protein
MPLPTWGTVNITNAPLFVDYASGNLRLYRNSPCINAGRNAYVSLATDLDGNPRIVGGTVDVGAYEYQQPASMISYAWLQQYQLPTDGSADTADQDHDGMNNWQEWRAGTDPTDTNSALRLYPPVVLAPGLLLSWTSVTNRSYSVERSANLNSSPSFSVLRSNILGQAQTTTYTHTNITDPGPFFYRVRVEP